jgi:AraC-like DNA-binding protein
MLTLDAGRGAPLTCMTRRSNLAPLTQQLVAFALAAGPDSRQTLIAFSQTLGLTTRSLQRRLRSEGTTYRAVLDDVRLHLAERALIHSPTVAEAARRAGFSEAATFHRAFKRWTGMTPKEFCTAARAETTTVGPHS